VDRRALLAAGASLGAGGAIAARPALGAEQLSVEPTLFDYVRRAMPFNAPRSLSNDEVYAVCAYILQLNGIIGENTVMDAQILVKLQMPNRDGFVPFSRQK
jgi:hypothetical protein